MQKRKRFGEILVDAGLVSQETLTRALEQQRTSKQQLGRVLEEMGVVTERDIAVAIARQFGFNTVSRLAKASFGDDLLALIDSQAALAKLIFPLKIEGKTLYLAMVNPLDIETIDRLSFKTGLKIVPCVTTPTEIQLAVKRHYFNILQDVELAADRPDAVLEIPREVSPAKIAVWRILVIDPQPRERAAVLAALKGGNVDLQEAADGVDGYRLAMQQNPHLIVCAVEMPRMDGQEFFRTVQATPQTSHIPVLALLSRESIEEEVKLLDLGFSDVIARPFAPARLTARARHALRQAFGRTPPR